MDEVIQRNVDLLGHPFTKRMIDPQRDLVEIKPSGLTECDIVFMDKIIADGEMLPTEKLLHLCNTVGSLPYLLGVPFLDTPQFFCSTPLAEKEKPNQIIRGPETLSGELLQRVLPFNDKEFKAKPPVSNLKKLMGHIGANLSLYQMLYNETGGLAGDGEISDEPCCEECGMPRFNSIYHMFCITQVASHGRDFDCNYGSCHIAARHLAANIDRHTESIKEYFDSKYDDEEDYPGLAGKCVWTDCKACAESFRFGSAMSVIRDVHIRRWLDGINKDYAEFETRWFIPQRHFVCYSLFNQPRITMTHEEIEERRDELLQEQKIHTIKKTMLQSLGVDAVVVCVSEETGIGELSLTKPCLFQETLSCSHDHSETLVTRTRVEPGTPIYFNVDAIPSSLQGTDSMGNRTFYAEKGQSVICGMYRDQIDASYHATFVIPDNVTQIRLWASKAANSFYAIPFLRPMYCEDERLPGNIVDTITKADSHFKPIRMKEENRDLETLMKVASESGAPTTNNLSIPILMKNVNAPWIRSYIKANQRADAVISQGGPADWAVPVAEIIFNDPESVPESMMKKSDLQIWTHILHKIVPFARNCDCYRGIEKLQSACLRLLLKSYGKPVYRIWDVDMMQRHHARKLRDLICNLGKDPREADLRAAVSEFLEWYNRSKRRRF